MILVGINPDAAKIACAGGTPDPIRLFARMLPVCGADRNLALRDVVVDGRALALLRVAVASAPGRLHQKTLAGLHLVTARRRRFELVRHGNSASRISIGVMCRLLKWVAVADAPS